MSAQCHFKQVHVWQKHIDGNLSQLSNFPFYAAHFGIAPTFFFTTVRKISTAKSLQADLENVNGIYSEKLIILCSS